MSLPSTPRVRKGLLYPFDKLEIGQGFIVPKNDAGWKIAKITKGPSAGLTKKSHKVAAQASYYGKKWGKKFTCLPDENQDIHVKRLS